MSATFNGIVRTYSGSSYEFRDGMVRRVNDGVVKRADGEWVRVIMMFPQTPEVGFCMTLVLESLATHGPDDEGNEGDVITTRMTSVVTSCDSLS